GRILWIKGKISDKDIAYLEDEIPAKAHVKKFSQLADKLNIIAKYAGRYIITNEAKEWGKQWYKKQKDLLRSLPEDSIEGDALVRKPGHLHKLAMVISASRLNFPTIELRDLIEADEKLKSLEIDTVSIFNYIGQVPITQAAMKIVEIVRQVKLINKGELYRKNFFRTTPVKEFEEAIKSAMQAGLIEEVSNGNFVTLKTKGI
ncbi:MAG: hypothetical protein AABX84_02435, partial [Nanoarchaeota archaeon]